MLFLLRQRLVLAPGIVFSVAWALLLVGMTVANGKGSVETIATLTLVSIVCGFGVVALTVGPAFVIHRHLKGVDPVLALEEGEQVLFVAPANHVLDGEARGGRLLVTDRRIAHRPHRYNVQLDPWSVPFESVRGVRHRLPTFVLLDLEGGKVEKLVVPNRREMTAYLDGLRGAPRGERPARSVALCREHALFSLTEPS